MNNNQQLFDETTKLTDKQKRNKKYIHITLKILFVIIIIFSLDFAFTLIFKSRPIITINKTNEKYGSIFYDLYICNDKRIIRFKTQKFSCQKSEENNNVDNTQKDNIDNVDKPIINSNIENQIPTENNKSNDDKDNNFNDITDNEVQKENVVDNNNEIIAENKDIKIIDKSNGSSCAEAIEYYYEDNDYKYYFNCIMSNKIFVIVDGNEYTIKEALNNKIVTMNQLIDAGFKPLKESKNLVKE